MSQFEASPATVRSQRMELLRWFVLVTAACLALALGMGWVANTVDLESPVQSLAGEEVPAAGALGKPAPDFRLPSLDGGLLGPPDFPNQVVLVEFWATWCGPCRLQAKFLEELHREFEGKAQFLAVDSGESESTVRKYVEKTPFPYPVLLDQQDSLTARFQIMGLPTVMIINREGEITFMETGVTQVETLRHALRAAGAA